MAQFSFRTGQGADARVQQGSVIEVTPTEGGIRRGTVTGWERRGKNGHDVIDYTADGGETYWCYTRQVLRVVRV